jgi:hypothetical protein
MMYSLCRQTSGWFGGGDRNEGSHWMESGHPDSFRLRDNTVRSPGRTPQPVRNLEPSRSLN